MKNTFPALLLFFMIPVTLFGQDTEVSSVSEANLNELIDLPVSSVLAHGEYEIGLRVYPNGGVLSDFSVGLLNRFHAAIYFGGENLIGEGSVNWNPIVGVDARLRVVEETLVMPAISIGVSTQGFGGYVDSTDRYQVKSRGIYVVSSRNYITPVGDLGFHGGINVSLERDDKDKDLNFFAGANLAVRRIGEALFEYDFGTNDNEDFSIGSDNGYLNVGFRFFITSNFKLAFHFKNLFENTKDSRGFGREIKIEYRQAFRR